MKAKILFTRLDNEENLSEEELVFQIIPNTGDGVYTKNKWYLRVAVDLVRIDEKGKIDESITGLIQRAIKLISVVTGIESNGN